MVMECEIPLSGADGETLSIRLGDNDRIFIVGANGTGKSALIQLLAATGDPRQVRWIAAHRQTWFHSNEINLTATGRRKADRNIVNTDRERQARWTDVYGEQRLAAVLYDLVASENARALSITKYVEEKDIKRACKEADRKSPFAQLNELLSLGALTVTLENSGGEKILARHGDGEQFSIAQLSDGERSAIIIAATVLTVEPGTLLLIDEPERHLHRAIIEPFLSAVFKHRTDCPFVISTHELALPVSNPTARVLITRSCQWTADVAESWEVEELNAGTVLPEDLRLAIMGSRRRILFVEGTTRSLDHPLYNVLFPDLSVIPKEGCAGVQRAVSGLRGAAEHHHVQAFGLIDRDDRPIDEVNKLGRRGVFALDVHSAEALYYGTDAIEVVARRQHESLNANAEDRGNTNPEDMVHCAVSSAIATLREVGEAERMAARRCERTVRHRILSSLPTWKEVLELGDEDIDLVVASGLPEEVERFKRLVHEPAWDALVARYPLRETKAFGRIVRELRCVTPDDYERMALSRAKADGAFADRLRAKIGLLSEELARNGGS